MILEINLDGGSCGDRGPAAAAVVVRDQVSRRVLLEAGYFLDAATHDAAQFQALIKALEIGHRFGAAQIHFCSASEMMVKRILGEYGVNSRELLPLFEQAQMLLLGIDSWQIRQVSSEENRRVDELVKLALEKQHDVVLEPASDDEATSAPSAAPDITEPAAAPLPPPIAPARHPTEPVVGVQLFDDDEAPLPPPARWKAKLIKAGSRPCPADCPIDRVFRFGPTVPEGLCIYAAQAIFDEEPLHWPGRSIRQYETRCDRCDAVIHIALEE